MNPALILKILQYGPSAVDLAFKIQALIESKVDTVSQSDWEGLKTKYATKTADEYLTAAGGAPVT